MSKIEGLLRLASMQSAEEVVLRAGEPPALRVRGARRVLSMPAMSAELVTDTLREVVGDGAAQPEGAGEFAIAGHGNVRVRWRTTDRLEITVARPPAVPAPTDRAHREGAPVQAPSLAHAPAAAAAASSAEASSLAAPSTRASQVASETAAKRAQPLGDPSPIAAASVSPRLEQLLFAALDLRASDLVLTEGREASAKVRGEMVRLEATLADGELIAMLMPLLDRVRRASLEETGSADFALQLVRDGVPCRFRGNLFRAWSGAVAVLRPISSTPPTLASMRLPKELARFAELRDGLVLFTGPAGSGKSTSLAALVEHLDGAHPRHVITIEDPIEHVFDARRAVIHQREVGVHVSSFATGLRAALRESPDVILLGEMRDRDTIAAAITAAETGHLVLSTLHSSSAAGAVDRIIDVFPEHTQRQVRTQLADVLRVIVAQRLLPTRDGGRVPALEILPVNAAVANLIREGKAFQLPQVLQTGRDAGMVPLARAIAEWVRAGVVDREVGRRHLGDPTHLDQQLDGVR